jgi:acyl-CoA thioester hydrolase
MLNHETKIRVRYGESDRMGYAYYGNYPLYFEVARTEMLRTVGFSYKEMEDSGIILPVHSMNIRYLAPAFYDDELTIKTTLKEIPAVRLIFEYEVRNAQNKVICTAETTLIFFDSQKKKPTKAPAYFVDGLMKLIK